MLRQYQTAARGTSSSLAPDSGWSSHKHSRDVFPTGHVRPMSTKILAVGVMLVGVLVLSVALIMGLEFPKYVHSHLRDEQCVLNDMHPKYQSWREGTQWTREVRLYYQHLLNPEKFLYHGARPLFEERGPYVYSEFETRVDVSFRVPEVTYRISRHHEFRSQMTAKECPKCKENDTLTLLNTDYLGKVYRAGSHTNYLLAILPASLQAILQLEGLYLDQTFSSNISSLGCLDSTCDSNLLDIVAKVSFGKWLRTSNANYSSILLNSRNSLSFNASEMEALYRVLLSSASLGSDVGYNSSSSGGATLGFLCRTLLPYVCHEGQQEPPSLPSNFNFSLCGLVHILQTCESSSLQHSNSTVKDIFISTFCYEPDRQLWCLDLSSATAPVLSAYFEAFKDFLLQHLLRVLQDYIITQRKQDLVVSRPQREMALGYYVNDVSSQSSVRVQGLLAEDWLKSSTQEGSVWKMDTCLQERSMNNNMRVREFNGSQYAPQTLMRDSSTLVHLSSHTDFFSACSLATCRSCTSASRELLLFAPSLRRPLRYTGGDIISLWDADVFRYWLSPDTFSWDSRYDVSCGVQNVTSLVGYVAWISLPALNMDILEFASNNIRNCSLPKPQSFVDVEPMSGRVWQRQTQLQLNAGIRPKDVDGPRLRPLNISYLDTALPVVWTERRAVLSSDELQYYNHKVGRLMKVSCGGLIGLSIVAAIIVVIGIVIFFLPKKVNRVIPALDADSSASNLHSRYHNAL